MGLGEIVDSGPHEAVVGYTYYHMPESCLVVYLLFESVTVAIAQELGKLVRVIQIYRKATKINF